LLFFKSNLLRFLSRGHSDLLRFPFTPKPQIGTHHVTCLATHFRHCPCEMVPSYKNRSYPLMGDAPARYFDLFPRFGVAYSSPGFFFFCIGVVSPSQIEPPLRAMTTAPCMTSRPPWLGRIRCPGTPARRLRGGATCSVLQLLSVHNVFPGQPSWLVTSELFSYGPRYSSLPALICTKRRAPCCWEWPFGPRKSFGSRRRIPQSSVSVVDGSTACLAFFCHLEMMKIGSRAF